MKRRFGFTMIELLTVIAIIAILSAILLPVLARAKDSAYRSGDIQHMNEIRTALQLYKVDNGAYPPAILGYATIYMTGPLMGQVLPANNYPGHLYSKRIPALESLRPAYDRVGTSVVTKAVWPDADPRASGSAPILDLDGDGSINPAFDDPPGARQAYGPADTVTVEDPIGHPILNSPCDGGGLSTDSCFYKISGFDVAEEKIPGGNGATRVSLRYARFWTVYGQGGGNALDDPRQLGYDGPPESTVITWDSFFRDYDGSNQIMHHKKELVLFLGGGARTFDSADAAARSWRVMP